MRCDLQCTAVTVVGRTVHLPPGHGRAALSGAMGRIGLLSTSYDWRAHSVQCDSRRGLAQALLSWVAVSDSIFAAYSSAQDVFAVSRTLLLGRLLWGEGGGLALDGLPPVVGVPAHRVERAVDFLCRAGIAELDDAGARVALTREGLRELAGV